MSSDVDSRLAKILTEKFDVPAGEISPSRTLEALDVDSVSLVELLDILQEEFEIKFAEDELTNENTVEQVVAAVTAKVRE